MNLLFILLTILLSILFIDSLMVFIDLIKIIIPITEEAFNKRTNTMKKSQFYYKAIKVALNIDFFVETIRKVIVYLSLIILVVTFYIIVTI